MDWTIPDPNKVKMCHTSAINTLSKAFTRLSLSSFSDERNKRGKHFDVNLSCERYHFPSVGNFIVLIISQLTFANMSESGQPALRIQLVTPRARVTA